MAMSVHGRGLYAILQRRGERRGRGVSCGECFCLLSGAHVSAQYKLIVELAPRR